MMSTSSPIARRMYHQTGRQMHVQQNVLIRRYNSNIRNIARRAVVSATTYPNALLWGNSNKQFVRTAATTTTTTTTTTTKQDKMKKAQQVKDLSSSSSSISSSYNNNSNNMDVIPPPTRQQLHDHFLVESIPMIGFGFMDQSILIQSGNVIDCTLGVMFGLSTLTAAALGSIVSMAAGVLFGGTVEGVARMAGLRLPAFTAAQESLPVVRRVGLLGSFCGVVLGCTLGLANLLLIDTDQSTKLKLQAITEETEFAFEVEASNRVRPDATAVIVRGPDVDGVLASMTAALTAAGCSLVELHASPQRSMSDTASTSNTTTNSQSSHGDESNSTIEDVFIVVRQGTKKQIPDDELDDLAHMVLEACKDPLIAQSLKGQVMELEDKNMELKQRLKKLERIVQEKQIKVSPLLLLDESSSSSDDGGGGMSSLEKEK